MLMLEVALANYSTFLFFDLHIIIAVLLCLSSSFSYSLSLFCSPWQPLYFLLKLLVLIVQGPRDHCCVPPLILKLLRLTLLKTYNLL